MNGASPLQRFHDVLFSIVFLTLPWIGIGLVHLFLHRDSGAGLQPSYAAMAMIFLSAAATRQLPSVIRLQTPAWRWLWGLSFVAIALSFLGPCLYPSTAGIGQALGRYLRQAVQLAVMAVFVLMTVWWLRLPGRWTLLIRLTAVAVAFQFLYGCLQVLHFYHPLSLMTVLERIFTSNPSILAGSEELYLGQAFTGIPRIRGTACEPLYLGNYLLLAMPLLWLGVRRRRIYLLPLAMAFLLLIGTWSRGAWLAALAAALTIGLMSLRGGVSGTTTCPRLRHLAIGTGLVAAVLLALGLLFGTDILLLPVRRLLQSLNATDWSNLTRLYSMQAGLRAFCLSPVVGIGWGQFAYHFPLLVDPTGLQSQFTWPVVNNFPLMVLCETGLAGFTVLVAAGVVLARAIVRRRPAVREASAVLIAATVSFVGVWFQLLTFSQYNLPHIWISLALLISATRPIAGTADAGEVS